MNRKRTTILISVAAALVFLTAAIWLMLPEKEPRYEGKTVDDWMVQCLETFPRRNEQAISALQAMGEPAVQQLAWTLEHEDSAFKKKLLKLSERFPWIDDHLTSAHGYRHLAARTLGQMGPSAKSAIPALDRTARDPDRDLSREATAALILVRNEPIEPYIKAYQDYVSTNSARAYGILMSLGPAARRVVPVLLNELQSTNNRIRIRALTLLGPVGSESPECVAPLVSLLDDRDSLVRELAISALAQLGDIAKPAIPAVVAKFSDESVRGEVLVFIWMRVPPQDFEPLRPLVERATHDTNSTVSGLATRVLEEKSRPRR